MQSSHQNTLVDQLKLIFPNEKPIVNSRKQSQLRYSPYKHNHLELDVWYPDLNICFEYQDSYHYDSAWYYHKPLNQVQLRDEKKREIIKRQAIQLIVISCWWNGNLESLKSTVLFQCPDLFAPGCGLDLHCHRKNEVGGKVDLPITLNPPPPPDISLSSGEIPGIGKLTYPSFLQNPAFVIQNNWWLGEKYDGFRCCWNASQCRAYSRYGNELVVPPQLSAHIPSVVIDAEFWFGRGNFSFTYQLLSTTMRHTCWDLLRLIGFELVDSCVQTKATASAGARMLVRARLVEERYAEVLVNTSFDNPFVIIASRMTLLQNSDDLNYLTRLILEHGGEGVILQKFQSVYESGRSQSILKFKMMLQDQEGIVVGINNKAVQLKLPNGELIAVPSCDVYLSNLSLGDVVTFSSSHNTHLTRLDNPIIYRWRNDVSWRHLMQLYLQEQQFLNTSAFFSKATAFSVHELRHFMESFARRRNLNPYVPETWYRIKGDEVCQLKKGRRIIKLFDGYAPALQNIFPEISFDASLLNITPWKDSGGRRRIFENFAKERGFDALDPESWYKHRKNFSTSKEVKQVVSLSYCNNSAKALMDIFPEIGFEKSRFSGWSDLRKRRMFFENYARDHGFDPLDPKKWYEHPKNKIRSMKGARQIRSYHGDSIVKCLLELFPDIGLVEYRFSRKSASR